MKSTDDKPHYFFNESRAAKTRAIEALFGDEPNSPDEIDDFDVEEDDISFENSQTDSKEDYEDDILCEENLVNLSESEDSEERKI